MTDLKRLGNRPVPESYEALADPVYRGELCLIGNRGRPDPLLPLYIYNKLGKNAMSSLLRNISTLAAPSTTIRFLGKAQNRYGSVFVMPALFAEICESLPQVMVHYPSSGALAEPILLFWRTDIPPEKKALLSSFFASPESAASFRKVRFPVSRHPAADDIPIDPLCREKLLYRERWDLLL